MALRCTNFYSHFYVQNQCGSNEILSNKNQLTYKSTKGVIIPYIAKGQRWFRMEKIFMGQIKNDEFRHLGGIFKLATIKGIMLSKHIFSKKKQWEKFFLQSSEIITFLFLLETKNITLKGNCPFSATKCQACQILRSFRSQEP